MKNALRMSGGVQYTHTRPGLFTNNAIYIYTVLHREQQEFMGEGGGSQCVWYMWNENVKIEGEKEREKKREN